MRCAQSSPEWKAPHTRLERADDLARGNFIRAKPPTPAWSEPFRTTSLVGPSSGLLRDPWGRLCGLILDGLASGLLAGMVTTGSRHLAIGARRGPPAELLVAPTMPSEIGI